MPRRVLQRRKDVLSGLRLLPFLNGHNSYNCSTSISLLEINLNLERSRLIEKPNNPEWDK
jgi:hypothetical protein